MPLPASAAAALLVALLGGCTGVPTSSLPQTVESVGVGPPPITAGGPTKDAPPIQIVRGFLSASTNDPVKHSTARKYLTPAARNRWSTTTVTIIADEKVGTYDSTKGTVTVTGRPVGSLDSHGVYTPTLAGTGHGGALVPYVFGIEVADGQNLISSLGSGLLLTEQQFRTFYSQRTLYYFDSAGRYLVPDPRYSPLIDTDQISDWMLAELVQQPQSLVGVVNIDPLVAQLVRISVRISAPLTTVQVPGARQLGPDVRDRLAAQVAVTLDQARFVEGSITLLDGDRKVVVPRVGGTQFRAADFASTLGPARPASQVYYLRDGRIRMENGKALPNPPGAGTVSFQSVGLARPASIGALTVAGVQRTATGARRLVIGTQGGSVRAVDLPSGQLTRPAWFPGRAEVWIGDGARLYRVTTDGRTSQVAAVQVPSVLGGGRLVAVRPSPDGSRVALVVERVNNQPQLYVAGVVRTEQTVQLQQAATLISPAGAVVTDAAWIDPLKLYAIGYQAQSKDSQVYRTDVDGAAWTNDGIGTLSNPPDSITTAFDASPWVSAEGFVWDLNGGNIWVSPVATNGQTPGTNPIYLG